MFITQRVVFAFSFFLICLISVSVFAQTTNLTKTTTSIRHANTYFWLGIVEKGNMDSFYQGLTHLSEAEENLKKVTDTKKGKKLKDEIDLLRRDYLNQMEIHFDTLHGVFPVVRLLVPNIFWDALTLGTYEVVDKPSVMASTAASLKLAQDIFNRWNARPQLNVIFKSNSGRYHNDIKENIALEQEVLYVFGSLPKFFPHNSQMVRSLLSEKEYEIFRNSKEGIPNDIIKRICNGIGSNEILVVSVDEADANYGDYFYIAEGNIYNIDKKDPTHSFHHSGFSRDRNTYFWPIIISFVIGLLMAVFSFKYFSNDGKMSTLFNIFEKSTIVPIVAYLIGRISAWIIVPMLGKLIPEPETLWFISFWWPGLVGVSIFLVPVLIYLQLSKYMCFFDEVSEDFQITGNGAAILLSITIGTCFYLIIPLMLYWDSIFGLIKFIFILVFSGFSFFHFGSVLDESNYKVSSKTLTSCLYLMPILFVLGLLSFLGETIPYKNYWYSPSQSIFFIGALFLGFLCFVYFKYIKKQPVNALKTDVLKKEEIKIPEKALASIQPLMQDIRSFSYPYWESDAFKQFFNPTVDSIVCKDSVEAKTKWIKITGASGCGKSAAAKALIDRIVKESEKEVVVFSGQCRIHINNEIADTPYEPFLDAFPENLIKPLISPGDVFHKIGDSLNPADMIPSFLGLDGILSAVDKDSNKIMGEQRQKKLFSAVAKYIREKAEQNIVIITFDNIQEIDSVSEKLLNYLFEKFPEGDNLPVLFVMVMEKEKDILMDSAVYELNSPDLETIKQILLHSLYIEQKSAKIISEKFNLNIDNQLHTVFQYIYILAETGVIVAMGNGEFTLNRKFLKSKHSGNLPEPENYLNIIKAKLDLLSKQEIKILQYAACLGENFKIEILSECLNNNTVIDHLEEIEIKSGVIFDNTEEDGCYSFRDALTLEKVRGIFNISFEGPPWSGVSEKIKSTHGTIANYFYNAIREDKFDSVFEACIHFYASGGSNFQKTIECCNLANKIEKENYNFDLAKDYLKMKAACYEFQGSPLAIEEEILLLDCEKIHVQNEKNNENTMEIADKCLVFYEKQQGQVSPRLLKVIARICYEIDRDIKELPVKDQSKFTKDRKFYQTKGFEAAKLLFMHSEDLISQMESLFFQSINRDDIASSIADLKKCLQLFENVKDEQKFLVEGLVSFVEDQLARKIIIKSKDYIEAKKLYKSSIGRKEKLKDKAGLSRSLGGLGDCLIQGKRYNKARSCYIESLRYANEINDKNGQYLRYYNIANSFIDEAQDKTSMDVDKDQLYQQAIDNFNEGLEVVSFFDEAAMDISSYHLYVGLLLSTARMGLWEDYNQFGNQLEKLILKGFSRNYLFKQIDKAIQLGQDHAGDWSSTVKESIESTT